MAEGSVFDYFVIGTFLLSFLIAAGIFYYSAARPLLKGDWFRYLIEWLGHGPDRTDWPRHFADVKEGFLSLTQNFGRVYLALFVTFVIATLLYLKVITAEAGLPILSGIAGFALGNSPNNSQGPPPTARGE